MTDGAEERRLRQILETIIENVQGIIKQVRPQGQFQEAASGINTTSDVNIHVFTLDAGEEALMSELKTNLETVIIDNLPSLSKSCRKYLLDFLNQYSYNTDAREFKDPFNIGILDSFARELQSILASLNGFRAAWNGDEPAVQDFIRKYPTLKDKSGLWGITLLYSAARNNHLSLVKYLISRAGCSVNAQNQQHIMRALAATTITDNDYEVNPTAGSTALHGACYHGHLEVVKYLIEKGADYLIKNQAEETPIDNATGKPALIQFFRDSVIVGYSDTSTTLPNEPIPEETESHKIDCVWEYKPFADPRWFAFSDFEASQLQQSLIVKHDQEFKHEIHLKVNRGVYSVSMMKFLRSGRDLDYNQSVAWIRCRGSSILNFDCYALWQIMFITHPEAATDPTLEMQNIPTIYDSTFKVHLSSWYFVDARTNNQLDQTMKNRRKEITLDIPFINTDKITFNLQTFSFKDKGNTTSGFIRWIPKMISNNARNKEKIISGDQYETLANMDPIPLTTARLKEISQTIDDTVAGEEEELGEYINDEDATFETISNANDDDTIDSADKVPSPSVNGPRTLQDVFNAPASNNTSSQSFSYNSPPFSDTTDFMSDDETDKNIVDCISEAAANSRLAQQVPLVEKLKSSDNNENSATMNNQLIGLKEENEKLQASLINENAKVQSLVDLGGQQSAKHEQQLSELMARIDDLQKQKEKNEREQERRSQIGNTIKTIEYNNIQKEIIHEFLTPKFSLVLDYLRDTTENVDASFADKVPKMKFQERNGLYIVTIVGFQGHQNAFKALFQRISLLLNLVQSAKDFYQRNLNRTIKLMTKDTLPQVKPQTQVWREYAKLFLQLLKEKTVEHQKTFDDYIQEKLKLLTDSCILAKLPQPWITIRKETDDFLKNNSLMHEIEIIKQNALNEFIQQNISMQHLKLEKEPTPKSMAVIKRFIGKIQTEFKNNKRYQGHQIKHFNLVPKLLERLMLYYSCFKTQLPLYESSEDLLDRIENNAVTTISTSTGSGKSTLLPALLIAEGYDKVIVTQPRRLPCQLICKRVNETMTIDVGSSSKKLAGWAISGADRNPEAKVLYLTDGLLKERLLYDKNFITTHTQLNKYVVFFIDEVHERSVNIDLCLALLARLLTIQPELKTKMKVIISSATLDSSVPNLFRKIPQAGLAEFKMPQMGTLFKVDPFPRPNENIIDLVQELCKKRKRREQILCFVSSVADVNQCCRLISEISQGTIVAYPLVQSQHPDVQQANIEHGTVFFSTTVAETSLTFPCLKYVIDTGMINVPVYDIQSKRTILKEIRAAASTIKQRFGRLGRTQPGEYYSLYNYKVDDVPYPIPQICQSDLMNLEFSLRKSPLQKGLQYMQDFLPDKPSPQSINWTIQQLKQLNIVEKASNDNLTGHGKSLAKLPDFGSLAMSKSVLAALRTFNCGRDLICLSCILGVLNTTTIFKSLPQRLKSADGDFMTLLNVMDEILLVKQSVQTNQFDLQTICQRKGLTGVQHIIKQALRRYSTLEKLFGSSDEFREPAQVKSGNWEFIAKALLEGYSDNVFVSQKELQDRNLQFIRYNGQGGIAVLDLQSTLTRPINTAPVSLILARDIRHSTAIRATAILSFVGEIKPDWVEYTIERQLELTNEEIAYLNTGSKFSGALSKFSRAKIQLGTGTISLSGPSGTVLNAELHLRQQMITELKFSLRDLATATNPHENFERNLISVMKMIRIFNPMKWRWQAQKQVEITINSNTATKTCEITVKGRDSENKKVRQEFVSFIKWLEPCAAIRFPNDGVSPRVLRQPMRKACRDIEERIARITDSKRTPIDLYNGTKGAKATRETRMEVVAWIAVCRFDCKVEGGFVRDWVVGHYTGRPKSLGTNPKGWIENVTTIPSLNKEVVPCDLDCHLPSHAYFDINKFQDELYKYGIICTVYPDNWRYVLLFDENETTGPFTMDLIEPHVALTHDRIDFDVNNLSLEKDYTHELGMRIDVTQKPYSIELETIVDNIKNKRFQVLRRNDHTIKLRIDKMTNVRGWTKMDEELSVMPKPQGKHHAILVPLPKSAVIYTEVSNKMKTISGVHIVSIEEIRNPDLEETYEGMKKLIKKQCKGANPNEQELFHGTNGDGIEGIKEDGFDDRYFNAGGMYGHGAYFADNPQKSHNYTGTSNPRVMYYNKVLLGTPWELTAAKNDLVSAPKGYHSVIGKHSNLHEYIIYRYGQALPFLKITYTA